MQIKTSDDVRQLGTILSVWAHPDDETFCAGGLMAVAITNGQTVICITATKGEAGVQDEERWPAKELASIREKELHAALKVLGIKEHHFLQYKDGECKEADVQEAAKQIQVFIEKRQPDTILTFGLEGLTGHPDHQAISGWVDAAVELASHQPKVFHAVLTVGQYKKYLSAADEKLNLFYNIEQPPLESAKDCGICFCCTDSLCDCKYDAFTAMPSQYTKVQETLSEEYVKEAFRIEAFVKGN